MHTHVSTTTDPPQTTETKRLLRPSSPLTEPSLDGHQGPPVWGSFSVLFFAAVSNSTNLPPLTPEPQPGSPISSAVPSYTSWSPLLVAFSHFLGWLTHIHCGATICGMKAPIFISHPTFNPGFRFLFLLDCWPQLPELSHWDCWSGTSKSRTDRPRHMTAPAPVSSISRQDWSLEAVPAVPTYPRQAPGPSPRASDVSHVQSPHHVLLCAIPAV